MNSFTLWLYTKVNIMLKWRYAINYLAEFNWSRITGILQQLIL